jgi:hyperpolarization activated cyclic nucleotide-gated potassium channel 1
MFIANFVTILQPLNVTLGEIIYQKGEHPNLGTITPHSILVYFLVHGRVNMVIGMHLVTFKTYVQGSYFGEVEIFDASPRMHTARAEVACDMLTISQQAFLAILKVFPQYY